MNPRAEAKARLGGRYVAGVLEPSPPAVNQAPWSADDPVGAALSFFAARRDALTG